MKSEKFIKPAFSVIGKMGSTEEGEGFISALWADANAHFSEIAHLAKTDKNGAPVGIWGAMSDFSLSFRPWEADFSQGLYLAGIECPDDVVPPAGWTKWTLPAFEYLRIENDHPGVFMEMLLYMKKEGIALAGAVQDFTDPATGKEYMLFPVKRI